MKKKALSIFLASSMILGLCACGSSTDSSNTDVSETQTSETSTKTEETNNTEQKEKERISLKVWGAQTDQDLLKELCEAIFRPENLLVDITGTDDINLDSEVTFEVPPMQVNSIIRREYI